MSYNKSFLFIILISILIYGCGNSQKKENVFQSEQQNALILENDSVFYPSDSDTIRIDIQNGAAHLKVHKKEREHVNFVFNPQDFTKMTARLSSKDSTANIRFTQIIMPNGDMDGPFGPTISYDLPVKGDYLLLVHENQMGGDPWSGDFEIHISLSK